MGDIGNLMRPAWAAIQRRHPALPDCAFRAIPAAPSPSALACAYAPGGWSNRELLAVEFTPAGLSGAPEQVFATLLHEAAHMLDWARWGYLSGHRGRFAGFCAELGLPCILDYGALDVVAATRNTRRRWPALPDDQIMSKVQARLWRAARYKSAGLTDQLCEVYASPIAALGVALGGA